MNIRNAYIAQIENRIDALNEFLKDIRDTNRSDIDKDELLRFERHAKQIEEISRHLRWTIEELGQ